MNISPDIIYGIRLERLRELIGLFHEAGYILSDDKSFKELKRNYFNKIEK